MRTSRASKAAMFSGVAATVDTTTVLVSAAMERSA